MRMAAVFTLSTSSIGHQLGVFPRWLSVLGYLVGLTLLFVTDSIAWSELVFPVWALIVSLHILVAGLRGRGVAFEGYDTPNLKTENGIASIGDIRAAWARDPDGNIIAFAMRT